MATVSAVLGAWRRTIRRPVAVLPVTAAALVAAVLSFGAGVAVASTTVAADSVSVVRDPGVTLAAPADGRLRGDHLAAAVTGVAFPAQIGSGTRAVRAPAGQRLAVFGLQAAHVGQSADSDGKAIPVVSGTLVVDGQRRPLPAPSADDGATPVYYRASVPSAAREVAVELAASGLAQTFSLITRTRVGTQPGVLYRDRDAWRPTVQVNAEQDLATPDPADGLAGATLPIRLRSVYLSWFGPDSPANVPAAADQAWLVLDAASQDDSRIGTRYLHYLSGLHADQVTVTSPGGQPVASQLFNPGTGETGVGIFDGIYAFTIPADVTAATVTVAPRALQVTVAYSGSTPQTITARGPARFPITFPAVYQPPPTTAATADAQPAALTPAAASPGGGGVPIAPITAAAGVVALAAGGAVYARSRRRAMAAPAAPAIPEHQAVQPMATTPQSPPWPPAAPPSKNGSRPDAPPLSVAEPPPEHEPVASVPADPPPPPPVPLTAIPAAPPDPPPGLLYIEVLGPFSVTGWPGEAPPAPVAELAAYLSLHSDRPRNAEELRDPLSAGRAKSLSADTIRTYANTLRRVLGTDRVPDAARRGYTVAGCTTDWQRFLDYRAAARPDAPPAEAAQALASCLSLVRGRPFSDLPVSGYGWVATDLLISQAEVAILSAAQRLADLAMTEGDWDLAAWAAERGLIVAPISEDLNVSVIRAAASTGRTDRLSQVWRDVVRRYRAADEDVPAHISEINSQLKQALHPAPTSSPRPPPSRTSR